MESWVTEVAEQLLEDIATGAVPNVATKNEKSVVLWAVIPKKKKKAILENAIHTRTSHISNACHGGETKYPFLKCLTVGTKLSRTKKEHEEAIEQKTSYIEENKTLIEYLVKTDRGQKVNNKDVDFVALRAILELMGKSVD